MSRSPSPGELVTVAWAAGASIMSGPTGSARGYLGCLHPRRLAITLAVTGEDAAVMPGGGPCGWVDVESLQVRGDA